MTGEKKNESPFLVAISLGSERDTYLIEAAVALAERTGRGLCLCHVVTSNECILTGKVYDGRDSELPSAIDQEILMAEYSLLSMVDDLTPAVSASYRVLVASHIEKGLSYQAEKCGASMILMKRGRDDYNFTLPGQSTILSLLQKSPVPLLVFPNHVDQNFLRSASLRIFAADNFRTSGEACARFIGEWTKDLANVSVCYFHCQFPESGAFAGQILSGLGEVDEDMTSDERQESVERIHQRNLLNLKRRMRKFEGDEGGRRHEYHTLLVSGPLLECLDKHVADFDASIVAFGKHAPFYDYEPGYSSMPLPRMLDIQRPILIVPCRAEPDENR